MPSELASFERGAWGPEAGTSERPIAVLVHGGPGLDHHLLLPLADRLAGRLPVLLVDLPGHGRSVLPSGRLPGLTRLEDATARGLARGLAGRRWVLVGHSLGAWLAREMIHRRRVGPAGLVLVAPPSAGAGAGRTAVQRAGRLSLPPLSGPGSARSARAEIEAHLRAELGGGPLDRRLEDLLDASVLRHPGEYRALLRNLHRRLRAPPRPVDPGCPTLVLVGSEDRTTPPHRVAALAAATARARYEMLEGLGHYPFLQDADAVAGPILDLVDQELAAQGAPLP